MTLSLWWVILSRSHNLGLTLYVVFSTGSLEGEVPMREFPRLRRLPSKNAARSTAWESYACHHFGKQVSHIESDSTSMTAWIGRWVRRLCLKVNQMEVS